MIFLLARFVARRLLRDWIRTGLALAGVALGVAVFLAIRIANTSVIGAFASTVNAIAGLANLEISAPAPGLDERLFPRVVRTPGVIAAAPLVEVEAPLPPAPSPQTVRSRGARRASTLVSESPSIFVLGIDPFRQVAFSVNSDSDQSGAAANAENLAFLLNPLAVEVTASLASSLHLHTGSRLPVISGARRVALQVVGVMPADPLSRAYGGKVGVMDIAAAQETFDRFGRLDQILVRAAPGDVDRVKASIRRWLPASATVQRPSRRTATVERMLGAFQLNLEALSLIALFVGMFLIYNTLSAAVVRRRGEIGALRSLGVTRGGILTLVLAEAGIVGAAGSALGLLCGYGMARGILGAVATTVSSLYVHVEATHLDAPASLLFTVWLVGVAASLVAALAPAMEASVIEPGVVMRQGAQIRAPHLRWVFFGVGAAIFALLAVVFSYASREAGQPLLSFAAAFSILFGFSLLAPAACLAAAAIVDPIAARAPGIALPTGSAFLRASLERVWVVAAALAAAVSMLVGLSTMVGSFRQTVGQWVAQTVIGDVYVAPSALAVAGSAALLPNGVLSRVRLIPGVAQIDEYRFVDVLDRGRDITLTARRIPVMLAHPSYQLRHGDLAAALHDLGEGNAALVSSTLAALYHVNEGGILRIPTPAGRIGFRVAGIFPDYSSDQGVIVIPLETYRRIWRDESINSLALYLKPGARPGAVADAVDAAFPRLALNIRTNGELRAEILRIFDQTFRVTYALEAITVLVALLGIASTLITLALQRSRQFAILRAVGASREQVMASILVEAGLIGGIAWALGSVCGTALAAELIYFVLPAFFHWTVQLNFQPQIYAWSFVLVIPAALLAGALPALAASRIEISRGMRVE